MDWRGYWFEAQAAEPRKNTLTGVFSWLRIQVSNLSTDVNETNATRFNDLNNCREIILNDEEKARLVMYFNVLIEMDKNNTNK